MLHESYVHEMLARAARNPGKHELARQCALAELRLRPGLLRQLARHSGLLCLRFGAWLIAYGAGPDSRSRRDELRPYTATSSFSQN